MGSRSWNLNRDVDSPIAKNSVFHNYYDDLPNSNYPEDTLINEEDKYTYQIIACNSGTEVFEKYNSTTEYQPTTRQIYIFVEKKDNKKSNLFGSACRVKMGEERKTLMQKLLDGKTKVSVHDDNQLAKNLKDWADDIAYYSKGKSTEIEATVLLNAVKLELVNKSDFNEILQTIFGLNNKLSDWMNSGVEAMEKWKFKEENYEYNEFYAEPSYNNFNKKIGVGGLQNKEVKYRPIIPVTFPNKFYQAMSGDGSDSKIAASGINSLLTLEKYFDEISFGVVYNVVKATPNIEDDIFFAVVFYIKNYLEEYVLGSFKEIFKKIKELIAKAINFLKEIASKTADFLSEPLAILNAFLCGLINGIISLFQTIIIVLSFVVDNISILEIEKTSKTEISKHQEKLEFVEDLIDLISDNAVELFSGIISFVTDSKLWKEANNLIEDIWKTSVNSIKNTSKYFWAYVIGAIIFEVILDVVIAFFTGGASVAIKVSAKISRLANKADDLAKAGIKTAQQFGKKVANSASDLYKWLKNKITELIEAIKSGKLIDWIREQLHKIFRIGKKAELKLRGEVIVLKGFKWKKIKYVKRLPADATKLRRAFDSKIRKEFLADLLKKPYIKDKLKKSGISDEMIERMETKGKVPDGWNVHHKLPLDDGGTNDFGNLMLIKDEPYHKAITAFQKTSTNGMQPNELLETEWPFFDGYLYP